MRLIGVAFLLLPATAWAQGITLEGKRPTPGDMTQIRIESALDLDVTIKDSEPERTKQFSQTRTDRFGQQVVAIEDGASVHYRISCASSELERSGTDQPLVKGPTALHGRALLVKRGSTTTVEPADGLMLPAGVDGLGGWEEYVRLLPSGAVEVGATWAIDRDVSALLSVANMKETRTARFQGTFKSLEGTVATISFTGEIEGTTRDNATIKVSVTEGELVFDTATGRPTSIRIAGSLEATKDVIRDYIKPGGVDKIPEKVGEIRTKSRKLEVKITLQ